MSNAAHRRTREVPAGRIVAAVAAILALFGVLMLVASLTSPASAGTVGRLSPAISAAKALRPYWDGRAPVFWTAAREPLCKSRYAGRIGIALDGQADPFAMECEAEGDSGPWSWTVLGTRNGHSLSWWQVRAYCRQVGCKRPAPAVLRDLGVSPHVRAWVHVAGTTAIYVKHGTGVTVYIS